MRIIPALVATLVAVSPAAAQSHPSFSGTWVMDTSKVEAGPITPLALTMTVEQGKDTLKVKRDVKSAQGDAATSFVYGFDGKGWRNSINAGGMQADAVSTLSWEGSVLVISTTISVGGQEVSQVEKWTMDASGKSMTSERTVSVGAERLSTRLTLDKR